MALGRYPPELDGADAANLAWGIVCVQSRRVPIATPPEGETAKREKRKNPRAYESISHLLDKPADPTILSHRTVEPNLTARKLTSLATHAMPIPDKRGLTHRSRRPRGDIAT